MARRAPTSGGGGGSLDSLDSRNGCSRQYDSKKVLMKPGLQTVQGIVASFGRAF